MTAIQSRAITARPATLHIRTVVSSGRAGQGLHVTAGEPAGPRPRARGTRRASGHRAGGGPRRGSPCRAGRRRAPSSRVRQGSCPLGGGVPGSRRASGGVVADGSVLGGAHAPPVVRPQVTRASSHRSGIGRAGRAVRPRDFRPIRDRPPPRRRVITVPDGAHTTGRWPWLRPRRLGPVGRLPEVSMSKTNPHSAVLIELEPVVAENLDRHGDDQGLESARLRALGRGPRLRLPRR